MASNELRSAWRFFQANAGYSIPPGRAACALSLAKAELWAREEGARFIWREDPVSDWDGDGPAPEAGPEACRAYLGDDEVSLWGIWGATDEYRRVVQAELAVELQENLFSALGNYIRSL
jgi:hypothetical protein